MGGSTNPLAQLTLPSRMGASVTTTSEYNATKPKMAVTKSHDTHGLHMNAHAASNDYHNQKGDNKAEA